jgi:hypothetical protein
VTTGRPAAWTQSWRAAAVIGVSVGVVYVLSPLTVWFGAAMALLVWSVRRDLVGDERRWVTGVVVMAIVTRVAAVAALFLVTNHANLPFGHFFGDEEYFIRRSIWLRNVAIGIPIHGADLIYAFDDYSRTSYLYVLALVQILVGPSPYGVHLLAIGCYVAGCAVMFRLVRSSLGRMPAFGGLALLLFIPSQFAWSVSALKDPLFLLLSAITVALALRVVRGPSWRIRAAALVSLAALAIVLETLRSGGLVLALGGVIVGLSLATLVARPRWLLAAVVAAPLILGLALSRPAAQIRVYAGVQAAVKQHWGHIATAGYVYRLLDQRLYDGKGVVDDLEFGEAARFVVRAMTSYVTVPVPWEAQSTATLLYLPEQLLWYLIVALAPIGVLGGFRRDSLLTSLLVGYAALGAVTVALTSGNIGTLVRHRGLALPYIVWLSAVGACDLIRWALRRGFADEPKTAEGGTVILEVQPTWR